MKKALWQGVIIFSILFTVTTLTSSVFQLLAGQTEDTNAHILMRGGFVFIATITMVMFFVYPFKNKVLHYLMPYAIAQSLVFVLVFLTGLTTELHPDAYRDAFFNFTGVAVIVIMTLIIIDYLKSRKKSDA